jgi:NAD(P)-dependent dehydrogenase (short-subunit alcohol dehydrogenase family)
MANLNGKVGIVTGGGTGIGKATALAMAKAGAAEFDLETTDSSSANRIKSKGQRTKRLDPPVFLPFAFSTLSRSQDCRQ